MDKYPNIIKILLLITLTSSIDAIQNFIDAEQDYYSCSGKHVVCVGPMQYKFCLSDEYGNTFASGEAIRCPVNTRCVNDGVEICVRLLVTTTRPPRTKVKPTKASWIDLSTSTKNYETTNFPTYQTTKKTKISLETSNVPTETASLTTTTAFKYNFQTNDNVNTTENVTLETNVDLATKTLHTLLATVENSQTSEEVTTTSTAVYTPLETTDMSDLYTQTTTTNNLNMSQNFDTTLESATRIIPTTFKYESIDPNTNFTTNNVESLATTTTLMPSISSTLASSTTLEHATKDPTANLQTTESQKLAPTVTLTSLISSALPSSTLPITTLEISVRNSAIDEVTYKPYASSTHGPLTSISTSEILKTESTIRTTIKTLKSTPTEIIDNIHIVSETATISSSKPTWTTEQLPATTVPDNSKVDEREFKIKKNDPPNPTSTTITTTIANPVTQAKTDTPKIEQPNNNSDEKPSKAPGNLVNINMERKNQVGNNENSKRIETKVHSNQTNPSLSSETTNLLKHKEKQGNSNHERPQTKHSLLTFWNIDWNTLQSFTETHAEQPARDESIEIVNVKDLEDEDEVADVSKKKKFSKKEKKIIKRFQKTLKDQNCEEDQVYGDYKDCRKFYRCVEKSDELKFEHLRCDDDKKFDVKKEKCVKKDKAECYTLEDLLEEFD